MRTLTFVLCVLCGFSSVMGQEKPKSGQVAPKGFDTATKMLLTSNFFIKKERSVILYNTDSFKIVTSINILKYIQKADSAKSDPHLSQLLSEIIQNKAKVIDAIEIANRIRLKSMLRYLTSSLLRNNQCMIINNFNNLYEKKYTHIII